MKKGTYRGWTIITERYVVQVGKSHQVIWECRAYRRQGSTRIASATAEVSAEGEASEAKEAAPDRITPARSLDKEIAYREARARIDRIVGTHAAQDTKNKRSTTNADAIQGEGEMGALAAEFSRKPKLLNLTYRVENGQANHRREPRRLPKFRIRSIHS